MGWTGICANFYKNGDVDRKAEIDSMWNRDSSGKYEVVKSTMVGSTYYGAIKRTDDDGGSETFGVVYLTSVNNKDYCNFMYKDMDETCGPNYYDCPQSILKLLSPTENEWALEWREKCWEKINAKKQPDALNKLPLGSVVEFTFNGSSWSSGHRDGDKEFVEKQMGRSRSMWIGGRYKYSTKLLEGHYKVIYRAPKSGVFQRKDFVTKSIVYKDNGKSLGYTPFYLFESYCTISEKMKKYNSEGWLCLTNNTVENRHEIAERFFDECEIQFTYDGRFMDSKEKVTEQFKEWIERESTKSYLKTTEETK